MPGGLPEPLSSLIGREREITGLVELLHSRRLVTLTGPGGVGKSRLALAVAHTAPGPAWFAGLAELSDPDAVARAALDALGAPEEPGIPPLDTLVGMLCSRPGLLVLDNCEHLADTTADIAHAAGQHTGQPARRGGDALGGIEAAVHAHGADEVGWRVTQREQGRPSIDEPFVGVDDGWQSGRLDIVCSSVTSSRRACCCWTVRSPVFPPYTSV